MQELNDAELLRYNRQIILKAFDFDGQEALKNAKVLMLGAGGLGCAASQYLVASGIGQLTLIDDDVVDTSNLQRQVLHNDNTVGMKKVTSAALALTKINANTKIVSVDQRLDDTELNTLIQQHDIVVDCCDNLPTRNQLNRLCHHNEIPLISGAAIRFEGQVCVFTYQDNEPCYECLSALFGEQALTCVEAGILSPIVGIIGATQALETIKVLANVGETLTGRLLMLDGLAMTWREMRLPKRKNCPICGAHE